MRQRNHSLPPGVSISVPSWSPRMVLADGLLTETEADALLDFLKTQDFNTTSVVLTNGGSKALNHTVTSRISRTYEPHDHPALALLSERIEQLSFLPSTWAEGLSALRYEQGDYFRAHLDVHQRPGRATHSRVATCLLYLADLVGGDGGETYFPWAIPEAPPTADGAPQWRAGAAHPACRSYEGKDATTQDAETLEAYEDGSEEWSPPTSEGPMGLAVTPRKGRALLFWNRKEDGSVDLRSRHVGCPLVNADKEKWGVTSWIHYGCDDMPIGAGNPNCSSWAEAGECEVNRVYMQKNCRRSCGMCGCDDRPPSSTITEDGGVEWRGGSAECGRWASQGECERNPKFMHESCRRSCGLCEGRAIA